MPNAKLTQISNGQQVVKPGFSSIVKWHGYAPSTGASKAVFPKLDILPANYVTSEVKWNDGTLVGQMIKNFAYAGLKAEVGTRRGFLGFAWMESQMVGSDGVAGPIARTTYSQQWPCIGMPVQSQIRLPSGGLKSQTDSVLRVRTPANATPQTCDTAGLIGQVVIPFAADSTARQWEMTPTAQQGAELPRNRTITTLDAYGNPLQIQEQTLNADGTASGYSRTTANQYDSNAERARQGRLIQSTVTHVKP
jgi:hypothetical protein